VQQWTFVLFNAALFLSSELFCAYPIFPPDSLGKHSSEVCGKIASQLKDCGIDVLV
jgi:hypothetical protein